MPTDRDAEVGRLNQGCVYHERVRPAEAGARVLAFHAQRFPHSSLEEWRATIEAGRVRVNGRVAGCAEELRAGDRLEYERPAWIEPEAPLTFAVLHEDEAVLALEKPAGLQVLPGGPFHASTLLFLVRASAPERAASAPVHRLGRGTSGLILFGKTPAALSSLSAQFRARTARKTYLALAQGTALPLSSRVRAPIGVRAEGARSHALDGVQCVAPDGKPALTRLRVLARDLAGARSLVAAQPITGRANQIRVHLAAAGAPLVGDPLFGPGGVPASDRPPAEGGYFLHAAALSVVHPLHGARLKLRSRPAWLADVLAAARET